MALFKVEDGAPPFILCRHGVAAVLDLSRLPTETGGSVTFLACSSTAIASSARARPVPFWCRKAFGEWAVEQLKRTECFQGRNEGIQSVIHGFSRRPVAILHESLGKTAFSNDDAVRDADKVHL